MGSGGNSHVVMNAVKNFGRAEEAAFPVRCRDGAPRSQQARETLPQQVEPKEAQGHDVDHALVAR